MASCLLCNAKAVTTRQDNSSRTIYNCGTCGVYVVSDLAVRALKKHLPEASAFLRHRKIADQNDTLLISFEKAHLDKSYLQMTVDQLVEQFPQSFSEQVERTLGNLALLSEYPGAEIKVENLDSAPLFYLKAMKLEALSFMIRAMAKQELLEVNYYGSTFFPCGVIVSPKGWDVLSRLELGQKESRPSVLLVYNAASESTAADIKAAASKAAKESATRLVPCDAVGQESYLGSELAARVRESSYVLVDLSGAQPECYYAMGYAQALKKPLLVTCSEKERKKLKQDATRLGMIFWQDARQLQLEFYNYIVATT